VPAHENQVLKESRGKKHIRLTDDQRRRLAVRGKILGRKVLGEIGTIVTPDTILRWRMRDPERLAVRPPLNLVQEYNIKR
jgi:hypothetical protein